MAKKNIWLNNVPVEVIHELDVRKSVHHHTIRNKLTNKMQQFHKFILFHFFCGAATQRGS
jgi:hypothetical protein